MNFPKPLELTQATINRYVDVWTRLLSQARDRHPQVKGVALVDCLVDDLIARKPTITPNTFRQYKAAISYVLRTFVKQVPTDRLAPAINRLSSTSTAGCKRKSQRTSAKRAKRLQQADFDAINTHLREWPRRSVLTLPTMQAMMVLRLTGARPCELLHIAAQSIGEKAVEVTLRNAKATNGRALGEDRIIRFSGLTNAEANALLGWRDILEGLTPKYPTGTIIKKIEKYFSRAARRALGARAKYPTLYSLRHQFAADAKASGLAPNEVAALMGHASDVTAQKHYCRRTHGSGGIKARADQAAVNQVRRTAKPFRRGSAPRC